MLMAQGIHVDGSRDTCQGIHVGILVATWVAPYKLPRALVAACATATIQGTYLLTHMHTSIHTFRPGAYWRRGHRDTVFNVTSQRQRQRVTADCLAHSTRQERRVKQSSAPLLILFLQSVCCEPRAARAGPTLGTSTLV